MVNVTRLQEELEFITRNRAHHNQALWFQEAVDKENACGTTGCLAGWTAIHHAKDQLVGTNRKVWVDEKYIDVLQYEPANRSWTGLGAELLDLNWNIADELFHDSNTIWDLWNIANVITDGAIEIPAEVQATRGNDYNRTEGVEEYILEMIEDED